DPEPAAARRVVDLDPRRVEPEGVARLPGPREMVEHGAAERSREDPPESLSLQGVRALVDEPRVGPGRPFDVVAVVRRHHDTETTGASRSPSGSTFWTKIRNAMTAIQARLITPSAKSAGINPEQQPTQ